MLLLAVKWKIMSSKRKVCFVNSLIKKRRRSSRILVQKQQLKRQQVRNSRQQFRKIITDRHSRSRHLSVAATGAFRQLSSYLLIVVAVDMLFFNCVSFSNSQLVSEQRINNAKNLAYQSVIMTKDTTSQFIDFLNDNSNHAPHKPYSRQQSINGKNKRGGNDYNDDVDDSFNEAALCQSNELNETHSSQKYRNCLNNSNSVDSFESTRTTASNNKTNINQSLLIHNSTLDVNVADVANKLVDDQQTLDSRAANLIASASTPYSSSSCALVLKRTYIIDKPQKDAWGERFVFNDVDVDDKKKRKVHKTELCIKFSDVDKAIQEAKHKNHFEKPADVEGNEVSDSSIGKLGQLSMTTMQILRSKFDLSQDEILNALPLIDTSSSKLYMDDLCPKHLQHSHTFCTKTRYRTITAHCNNLKHPIWGASKTPFSRYLPPDYADGMELPRAAHNGSPLPPARLITSIVHQDHESFANDYSALFASWGQLIDHDMTRVAPGSAPNCCPQYLKGECFPIPVPAKDPLYKSKCLEFTRSLPAVKPKCLLGTRAQINTVTSPIDANFVYGSTVSQANKVRKFSDGKLKVWNFFDKLHLKPLLPPQIENPDEECVKRPKDLFCFLAGDVRVNEQTHLTTLHTVYMREHNRIAKTLANLNIDWDDDKIFHETRHIVIAGVQHCLVNEFLPLLLGDKSVREHHIAHTGNEKHWHGHDPSVTTATGTAFSAAAFRYGHSMVDGVIKLMDEHGKLIRGELLRFLFKQPFLMFEPGVVDQLISGMINSAAEKTDPYVTRELSGHLFQPPEAKVGGDLAAINIQRGRDLGVPSYNDWREWCGLTRAKSFSDLEPLLYSKTAHQYSKIYKSVDDIDLWSAGVSERRLKGAAVGPTFACIIARQFSNTKRGDRFWYENPNQPSSFTPKQLSEIKKITLSKILCTNSDHINKIQRWALRMPHPIYNPRVKCSELPDIDLLPWREEFKT